MQDNAEFTLGETKYGFANQKGGIFKGREVLGMLSSLAIGWESMGIDAAVIRGLTCTGYIICILHYITVTDRVHLSDEDGVVSCWCSPMLQALPATNIFFHLLIVCNFSFHFISNCLILIVIKG